MRIIAISICLSIASAALPQQGDFRHPAGMYTSAYRLSPDGREWDGLLRLQSVADSVPPQQQQQQVNRKKTTVPRRSKDPVNIPTSSGRFRRFDGSENLNRDLQYNNGWLRLDGHPSESLMKIMICPPHQQPRIYRFNGKRTMYFNIGSDTGEYTVTLLGSGPDDERTDCTFIFEIVD